MWGGFRPHFHFIYLYLYLKSLISPVGWVHVLFYIMLYSLIDMYNVTIMTWFPMLCHYMCIGNCRCIWECTSYHWNSSVYILIFEVLHIAYLSMGPCSHRLTFEPRCRSTFKPKWWWYIFDNPVYIRLSVEVLGLICLY